MAAVRLRTLHVTAKFLPHNRFSTLFTRCSLFLSAYAQQALTDHVHHPPAAHCPPEREVNFRWPDTLLFDGAMIGGLRLAWPEDCAENEIPDWLVVGVMLRVADLSHVDTGLVPGSTSLMAEGFELLDGEAIIASFTRHLMTHFDRWKERGFTVVAQDFFARLPIGKAGERRAIDGNGDLLVHAPLDTGPAQRTSLVEFLSQALWYDAKHGAPRLR